MKIVPNTVTIDITWNALMIATAFSDVRIHSLKAEFCAASTRGVRSTFVLLLSESAQARCHDSQISTS